MHHDNREYLIGYLQDQWQQQLAFLTALVRCPSDNPPGDCAAHAELTARWLEDLGFNVERHPVAEDEVTAHGMVSAVNLVVRQRFGPGPTIALSAHGDVVAPGEGWTTDPYGAEVRGQRMYGRGVAIAKSDFTTYAFALLALKSLDSPLQGAVELHFTYDDEGDGEIGPARLLRTGVTRPDYAIAAGFSYGVVSHHNGCLHLEVSIDGRSAHAAEPASGRDALETATAVLQELYDHRAELAEVHSQVPGIDHPTLVVGLINGGINTNVVPDRVRLRLDRRLIPEENPDTVEQELSALIHDAADRDGIRCYVRRVMLARPLAPLPGVQRLSERLCFYASQLLETPVSTQGLPLYTGARHYAEAGVPTVAYGAGPRTLGEANVHRADECLELDDLHLATCVVALTLYDLLSGD